eukprot:6182472-Pleurochrysis_carterae.AAC.3
MDGRIHDNIGMARCIYVPFNTHEFEDRIGDELIKFVRMRKCQVMIGFSQSPRETASGQYRCSMSSGALGTVS